MTLRTTPDRPTAHQESLSDAMPGTPSRPASSGHLDVRVANMDCDSDANRIGRALRGAPGVHEVSVSPKAARVVVEFDPAGTSEERLRATLQELGFPAQAAMTMAETPRPWKNPKVLTSAASGLLLFIGWLLSRGGSAEPITTSVFLVSLLIGGYYFGREALEDLVFEREIGIELLMTVAAIVATVMGEPLEGAMLAFLYSMSEAAEGYTEAKTRSAVRALMELAPKTVLVRRDTPTGPVESTIPVEEVRVGDVFIVRPGESMPTDGEVIAGSSSVNQAPVTGESVPVLKAVGDAVFAGTINGEGSLEARATKAFAENTIARIIHLVEEAHERKGTSERFIERFGRRYSPAVLAIGVLMAVLPPLTAGADWTTWITRATVFIVAAAPCALVISIPITLVAALGTGARNGVLIKGGVFIEALAKVTVVALDKTGTITNGEPEVTDLVMLPDAPHAQNAVLAIAAGIESRSQHPLARAVMDYSAKTQVTPRAITEFRSLTGAGAAARVEGAGNGEVFIGSPALFEQELNVSLAAASAEIAHLQSSGKTVIVVGAADRAWALIAIRDNVRANAVAAIRTLHEVGVKQVVMLTGDNRRTAEAIAREVGIDAVYADLKPEDKSRLIREFAAGKTGVAMIGDGVNDAAALAEATVGVAMGAAGTDVALETADVVLMADDLEKFVYAMRLAKRNQRVVQQNLALSVVVILVLVTGAVLGKFTLPVAVIGHELSEFIVIASGLRMLRS